METKLVVAIIHGMGDIHPDFADQFIDDVCDQISPDVSPQAIKFVPIHWGYITQPIQDQFYQRANAVADLDYKPVRKFILSALGDAAAYQKSQIKRIQLTNKFIRLLSPNLISMYQTIRH
ncbi:hypothetical protein [Psychrosphaera algicola]|uniref:Uncharacterized protein n=1 Tax=Psychrosphaera algicola TaxID=3023714 RepID=A0ABT5FDT7_9GAMM|nr:hypothetical protein [Psychrosphaera sp. G1-22]MDC2889688.1 hypothetical protein [Psychrosphaera sp. G1-22]